MSEPPKLEEDFRSIVVGGLISRASAEASGGLRRLRKLTKNSSICKTTQSNRQGITCKGIANNPSTYSVKS